MGSTRISAGTILYSNYKISKSSLCDYSFLGSFFATDPTLEAISNLLISLSSLSTSTNYDLREEHTYYYYRISAGPLKEIKICALLYPIIIFLFKWIIHSRGETS